MKQHLRTKVNKALLLKYLILSGGNISVACKNAGLSRTQVYEWRIKDPICKGKILKHIKRVGDFANCKLLAKALSGDTKALIALGNRAERQRINI